MSEDKGNPPKRSHKENGSAFPDDLEIPESALHDRKFLSSYVYILNDPRVYKRQRLNGDRTSSRFDVDYNCHINVVFNEPVIKRKSILTNTQSPKEKNPDDSGIRKSVSFLSKITFIDAVELDGGGSDWTDWIDIDESKVKKKMKSNTTKVTELKNNLKKGGTSNGIPSNKNNKKSTKDKSSSKKGNKVKSTSKELFKFKITKPFRKFGRSKEKKLKYLQKKFGKRMFNAFVHVKRSFNLKHIPVKHIPLERITMNKIDVSTPKKSTPSIQDFLIGQMTKKLKVCITPVLDKSVLADDTNEEKINDTEIIQSNSIKSNGDDDGDVLMQNSKNTENEVRADSKVDRNGTKEDAKSNQNFVEAPSTESLNADQTTKINGDMVPALSNDSPDMVIKNDPILTRPLTVYSLIENFTPQRHRT